MQIQNIKSIEQISKDGGVAVVRVDFNVPLDEKGQISDTTRIEKTLPTLEYLSQKKGLGLVLISHLGRPKNGKNEKDSLKPVFEKLKSLLPNAEISFCEDILSKSAREQASKLKTGGIMLCENIRFYAAETSKEEKERKEFAAKIAELGDIYVDDAFGACHRAHASIYELAQQLPCYAGLLLKREIEILNNVLTNPGRPFVAVIGGSKVSSKLAVLKNLIKKVDVILIGGAMAYTFLKSRALEVGSSMVENEFLPEAFQIIDKADFQNTRFEVPEDHIIANEFSERAKSKSCGKQIPQGWMGMDIGSKTIDKYEKIIKNAKTVLWNGPMGVFEMDKFAKGTLAIAKAMTKVKGMTIVGGGDSVFAVNKARVADKMTHISTGGGATLEFLEGKELPGIAVLNRD